jgi:hypothetical protein
LTDGAVDLICGDVVLKNGNDAFIDGAVVLKVMLRF